MQPSEMRHHQSERALLSLALVLIAVIGLTGWLYLKHRQAQERQAVQDELSATADYKAGLIESWIRERRSDAEADFFKIQAALFLTEPTNAVAREELRQWMATVARVHGYSAVALFDSHGVPRLEVPENVSLQGTNIAAQIQTGLRSREALFADLQQGQSSQPIYLDFLVPVFIRAQARPTADGVLFFQIDPRQFLFPLVQSWPTHSRSAETLLVRREGNDVVFLNDLRFRTNAALTLRFPIDSKPDLPAAMAVKGQEGLVEGLDYRGIPVLAVLRKISGTPWFMVAKVDQDEIYAPLREQAWVDGLFVGALMLAILLGFGIAWRQEQLKFSRWQLAERSRVEEALIESEERFRMIYEKSPMSYHSLDDEGYILDVNPAWLKLLGYERDEVLGRRLDEFFTPASKSAFAEQFTRFRECGVAQGNEYEMRRKDGTVLTLAFDGTFVHDEQGRPSHTHCVIYDITRHKQAEEALARERNLLRAVFNILPDYIYLKNEQSQFVICNNRPSDDARPDITIDPIGKTDADLFPPEQAAQFRADELAVLGGASVIDKEEIIIRPNGSRQVLLTTKMPFRDNSGKIVGVLGYGRDITERKQAETARENERHLLRTLIDLIPDIIYVRDTGGRFLTVNQATVRSLGRATPEELLGKTDADFYPAELAARFAANDREVFDGKTIIEEEATIDFPNGEQLTILSTKVPLKNIQGQVIGLVGVIRDITARKQAEEKLKLFRALIERSGDVIQVVDPATGRFLDVNESACRGLGYTLDEHLALTVFDVTVGVDRAFFDATMARAKKTDHVTVEAQHRRKDGTVFPVEVGLSLVTFDREYLVAVVRDITERKRVEAALRESEFFFKESQRAASIGSYKCDFISGFWESSEVLDKIFGIDKSYNRSIQGWINVVHPDDRQMMERYLREEVIAKGQPFNKEYRIIRSSDGETRWMLGSGEVSFDTAGKVVSMIGTIQDITERKRTEADLEYERNLLRTMLDYSPDHIYFKDIHSRFIKASQALAGQFGVKSPDEMMGKTDFDYFDEAHARPAFEDEQEIIRTAGR